MKVLPIAYFPSVSWFKALLQGDALIEKHESYAKQTLRNRCLIATADGAQRLSVPVVKAEKTCDVRVALHDNWQQKHWNAICTAYGESAFFDYYADDLREFFTQEYLKDHPTLLDFDAGIAKKMLELMDVDCQLRFTETFIGINYKAGDWTNVLSSRPYYQVFREKTGFLPDLSALDLLFNLGPEAAVYLTNP